METFKERKTGWITPAFKNRSGVAAVPTSARYRLDDEKSSTEILDWTSLTPASSIEITITPAQNALIDPTRDEEIHVLTVESTFAAGDVMPAEYRFKVRSLKFYP
jgi:hypothetical protein